MAGAVDELLSVACFGDDVAGNTVDAFCGYAGFHCCYCCGLGAFKYVVHGGDVGVVLFFGPANNEGAGAVGVVIGAIGATDVNDDNVACFQDPVGIRVVWVGAVGGRADNDEVDSGVPFFQDEVVEVASNVLFAASWLEEFWDCGEDTINGCGGIAKGSDFLFCFAHEKLFQHSRGQDSAAANALLEW